MARSNHSVGVTALVLSFWSMMCVVSAAHLSIEEQLEQLRENLDVLAAKEKHLEELELRVEQQESFLTELRSGMKSSGWNAALRQQGASKIPRCCCDLLCMGETVSGMYSIMGNTSVEMVFCDFSKPASDPSFQQWIGFASVKKSPTYFYVQRKTIFRTFGVPIPYEISKLNIGGAMDLPSGKFTAPAKGTYFFSWTGVASFMPNDTITGLGVRLYLNGNQYANRIGSSYVSDSYTSFQRSQLTLQSTVNLLLGDQVWLEIYDADPAMTLYDSSGYHTHFTGWLLDQDFSA